MTTIQLRRDTQDNWFIVNPVLANGEPGYDITNDELRVGDGSTTWDLLPVFQTGGGGGGGGTPPPAATTVVPGIVELATDIETVVGTDAVRAVTPHGVAAVIAGLPPTTPSAPDHPGDYVITDPLTQKWASIDIRDNGSATGSWVNRLEFFFRSLGSSVSNLVTWINEYGELRVLPAVNNTVGFRVFAAKDATGLAARSLTVPVMEVTNQRDGTRTTMFGVYGDGSMRMQRYKVTFGPTIPSSPEAGQIHVLTEI